MDLVSLVAHFMNNPVAKWTRAPRDVIAQNTTHQYQSSLLQEPRSHGLERCYVPLTIACFSFEWVLAMVNGNYAFDISLPKHHSPNTTPPLHPKKNTTSVP